MTAQGEGAFTVSQYSSDPTSTSPGTGSTYLDVQTASGSDFTSLTIEVCGLSSSQTTLYVLLNGVWTPVSPVTAPSPGCLEAVLSATSTPTLSQLSGTVFAAGPAPNSAQSLVAVTSINGALWYRSPTFGWQTLGGRLIFHPAVVAVPVAGGNLSPLFLAVSINHGVWVRTLAVGWHQLSDSGYCISAPAATVTGTAADPVLTISCVGGNHAVWYTQPSLSSGGWANPAGWGSLGGVATSAPALAQVGGVLRFFVSSTDGDIWTRTLTAGWAFLDWHCLGDPAVAAGPNGTAIFTCQGGDHALWAQEFNGSGWTGWIYLAGKLVGGPGLAYTSDGPVFYAESTNGAGYLRTLSQSWVGLGGQIVGGAAASAG